MYCPPHCLSTASQRDLDSQSQPSHPVDSATWVVFIWAQHMKNVLQQKPKMSIPFGQVQIVPPFFLPVCPPPLG